MGGVVRGAEQGRADQGYTCRYTDCASVGAQRAMMRERSIIRGRGVIHFLDGS
jgi:hypothetical protein